MSRLAMKATVAEALGHPRLPVVVWPDWENLTLRTRRRLLRWLDESGMALHLFAAAEEKSIELPEGLRDLLRRRRDANRLRTATLLEEFRRVNEALCRTGVRYAVLKGYSLVPEFCPQPSLRHHSDLDLLVDKASIRSASDVLRELGYEPAGEEAGGEIRFATPRKSAASRDDFLYAPPPHFEVEIHRELFEPANGVSLTVCTNWQDAIEWRALEGIRFPSLDLANRLRLQMLHCFRHVLHGWLRLGWLLEVANAARNEDFAESWRVIHDSMPDSRSRNACGLVLALAARVFRIDLPELITHDWIEPLPEKLRLWVDVFGCEWALADFPGGRLGLLIHEEFADSGSEWNRFLRDRKRRTARAVTLEKLFDLAHVANWVAGQGRFLLDKAKWKVASGARQRAQRVAAQRASSPF